MALINKLLKETVAGVYIHKLYSVAQKVGSRSTQTNRVMDVTPTFAEKRSLILKNRRELAESVIYVRKDLSIVNHISRLSKKHKHMSAAGTVKNLMLKGFHAKRN